MSEPDWPHPPRYRWLKRLTAGSLVLALVLGLVRVGWGWEARRRLARELAPVVAAGDPVTLSELPAGVVPDADNGALVFRRAMADIGTESPSSSSMTWNDHLPFPPRWHKMEDRSIATNGKMLAAVREARGYGRFDWALQLKAPLTAYFPPHIGRAHHLSNLLGDAALHAHAHEDDLQALERIRDQRHLSLALGAPPTLLSAHHYRVYSIEGGGLYKLQMIAAGLTVAPETAGDGADPPPVRGTAEVRPAPRPATRAQVRALIRELLDDREQAEGLRNGYASERAARVELAHWLAREAPLIGPMFVRDAARVARAHGALAAAAGAPDHPAAKAALAAEPLLSQAPQTNFWTALGATPRYGAIGGRPLDYTRILSTDVCNSPRIGRAIDDDFDRRADRRLAAASLAIQLYRADHAGRFPPSLDALAPRYLAAVPRDPFAADGSPIRYVVVPRGIPGGGDRPILYSVGPGGRDDTTARGPIHSVLPAVPCHSLMRGPDKWVDVSRWAPPLSEKQREEEAAAENAVPPTTSGGCGND